MPRERDGGLNQQATPAQIAASAPPLPQAGQPYREGYLAAGVVGRSADGAAVRVHYALGHRKAHARAARLRVAAAVGALKALEQLVQVALRQAVDGVCHHKHGLVALPALLALQPQLYVAAVATVARGVV